MFSSILVGVDRSQHARKALSEAVDIARTQHAALTVVVAYSTLIPWGVTAASLSQNVVDELTEGVRRDAEETAGEVRASIPEGLKAQVLTVDSVPAQAIIDQASAGGHDLIVVGSRGRGDATSIVLGSVSHTVLHNSRVPVLIVHVPSIEGGATR